MINGYEKLANEIVLQAVKDYRDADKKLARGRNNSDAKYVKEECLSFFKSRWFGILTELNPNILIVELEKEAQSGS